MPSNATEARGPRFKAVRLVPGFAVYRGALLRCAERGLRSGSVFDALHLVAAERSGAHVFLTFNEWGFLRLASDSSPRIVAPPAPPVIVLPDE